MLFDILIGSFMLEYYIELNDEKEIEEIAACWLEHQYL